MTNVNRIKHQRYLTMAETVGTKGGYVHLNAAGKIINVVPADRGGKLIPSFGDYRGHRIYASFAPSNDDLTYFVKCGIKEIYFAAEGNSISNEDGCHMEGINYEDDINDLTAQIRLSGRTDVPSET